MIRTQETVSTSAEWLHQDSLKQLCTAEGPFVTVYLPACHPGAADYPRAERVKNLKAMIRQAEMELNRRQFRGSIPKLLQPLRDFAESPEASTGNDASALFAGPGGSALRHFRFPQIQSQIGNEGLTVATHPHITPFLSGFVPEREFYVLAISKKILRLGRWRDGECVEAALPPGVPKSFEGTLILEQPDHELQGRTPAPGGTVHFGVGTERDLVHERLHNYLHAVDRELARVVENAPLVVIAVAEELAAYKGASKHPHLLTAKPTSPERMSWVELGDRALEAVLEARQVDARLGVSKLQDAARDHVVSGVRAVLEAAHEGRVLKLFLNRGAAKVGLLGPSFSLDASQVEGEQDLINAAAVETIRRGGEVYTLDDVIGGDVGSDLPMAALRYSVGGVV